MVHRRRGRRVRRPGQGRGSLALPNQSRGEGCGEVGWGLCARPVLSAGVAPPDGKGERWLGRMYTQPCTVLRSGYNGAEWLRIYSVGAVLSACAVAEAHEAPPPPGPSPPAVLLAPVVPAVAVGTVAPRQALQRPLPHLRPNPRRVWGCMPHLPGRLSKQPVCSLLLPGSGHTPRKQAVAITLECPGA